MDGKAGLLPDDIKIIEYLRRNEIDFFIIVNKVDGLDPESAKADFYQVGVSEYVLLDVQMWVNQRSLIDYLKRIG